jgi:hypothetical protein
MYKPREGSTGLCSDDRVLLIGLKIVYGPPIDTRSQSGPAGQVVQNLKNTQNCFRRKWIDLHFDISSSLKVKDPLSMLCPCDNPAGVADLIQKQPACIALRTLRKRLPIKMDEGLFIFMLFCGFLM